MIDSSTTITNTKNIPKPVVLVILDGWGINKDNKGNAIAQAKTPTFDRIITEYPTFVLRSAGISVGLKSNQPGSCAVGHMNIGFGQKLIELPAEANNSLADIIAQAGLKQLQIAETEKYAHLVHHFSGNIENKEAVIEKTIIPSKIIASYDQEPELSTSELTRKLISDINHNQFDFIATNLPNAYLISQTGNFEATIKAIEEIDLSLEKIIKNTLAKEGLVLITSDHGQAEDMSNKKEPALTTKNPVPFVLVGNQYLGRNFGEAQVGSDLSIIKPSGSLVDIAPTILKIFNLKKPREMAGKSLI